MVNKKARGKRSKTRAKLKKKHGKATVNQVLRPLEKGARIQIDIRPEMHDAMPPAIFQGSCGVVEGKQGSAYTVTVKKQGLEKKLLVAGIHLREQGGEKK